MLEGLQTELRSLGKGRASGGDTSARAAELNQQIQQYKMLYDRALQQESQTQGRGRVPANRQPDTQIAQR